MNDKNKCHVLIIPSWYPDRKNTFRGSFFREQSLALQDYGVQVGVLAAPQAISLNPLLWKDLRDVVPFEDDCGIPTYRPKCLWPGWVDLLWRGCAGLFKSTDKCFHEYLQKHGRPQVIHAHSFRYGGVVALMLSQKYDIPFVVTEHLSYFPQGRLSGREVNLARKVYSAASAVITVSKFLLDSLEQVCKLKIDHSVVIPNILPVSFTAGEICEPPETPFVFSNVGSLLRVKRQDILLAAFAQAFRGESQVRMRIAGTGPENNLLKKTAKSLGIENQVDFLGPLSRNEVLKEIQNSNVFVLSSDIETFSIAIIEALSQGRPVVTTACGGPNEIVGRDSGIMVKCGDVMAMAEAMQVIRREYNTYAADEIASKCRSEYSATIIIPEILSVYEQAIKHRD